MFRSGFCGTRLPWFFRFGAGEGRVFKDRVLAEAGIIEIENTISFRMYLVNCGGKKILREHEFDTKDVYLSHASKLKVQEDFQKYCREEHNAALQGFQAQ